MVQHGAEFEMAFFALAAGKELAHEFLAFGP
jgi:hypothetical protein